MEEEKPEYLTVAFDVKAPTFRTRCTRNIKGRESRCRRSCTEQVPVMKQVLHAMGIRTMEQPGLEADDILGTLAKRAEKEGWMYPWFPGTGIFYRSRVTKLKSEFRRPRARTEVEDYYAADVGASTA
ncbi:MAG: PIN domain-containing protein [Gallintestinimicrobium sp.]